MDELPGFLCLVRLKLPVVGGFVALAPRSQALEGFGDCEDVFVAEPAGDDLHACGETLGGEADGD